ncbi:hypothetical protein D3C73_1251420 [compost metagenome]
MPPCGSLRPGSVTSTFSACRRASVSCSWKASCLRAIISSIAPRTVLATCPITGRSSALSAPMPRRTSVSSPFLPRYFTRRSFSVPGSCTVCSFASASFFNASSFSFMACNSLLYFIGITPIALWGTAMKILVNPCIFTQKKPFLP